MKQTNVYVRIKATDHNFVRKFYSCKNLYSDSTLEKYQHFNYCAWTIEISFKGS